MIDAVSAEFADREQDRLDGLSVDCGNWWFNLRPSNTEPLLRLNLEAVDRGECDDRVADMLALITPPDDPVDDASSPTLLAILVCPQDKGQLHYLESEDVLFNPRLRRRTRSATTSR